MPLLGVGKSSLRPMGMTAQQFRGRGKKFRYVHVGKSAFSQARVIRVNDPFV